MQSSEHTEIVKPLSDGAQFDKKEHRQPPCGSRADNRGRDALPIGGKTGPLSRNENYPEIRTAPLRTRARLLPHKQFPSSECLS